MARSEARRASGVSLFVLLLTVLVAFQGSAHGVSLGDQGAGVRNRTSGAPLASANLTVLIYDVPGGGDEIYNQTFPGAVRNGSWSVMLGETVPLPLEFNRLYYKDYRINGEDVNFTDSSGASAGRAPFFSPLGTVNGSHIDPASSIRAAEVGASRLCVAGDCRTAWPAGNVTDDGGRVGVGTPNPRANLSVLSADEASAPFRVDLMRAPLPGWQHRRSVAVAHGGAPLLGYAVALDLDTASLVAAGKMRPDGADIRFTDGDEATPLPHWVESGMNTTRTRVWVNVTTIPAGSKTIYLYYGNPRAAPAGSGSAVFDLFDDFAGAGGPWVEKHFDGSGSAVIEGGRARVDGNGSGEFWGGSDGGSGIFAAAPLADDYAVETAFRQAGSGGYSVAFMSRAGLGPSDAFYTAMLDGDASHLTTAWRDAPGAPSGWAGEETGWARGDAATLYVRLTKAGPVFSFNGSADGTEWAPLGSRSGGDYHGYVGLVDSAPAGPTEFEWVRVRRYVSPEPLAEAGAEESALSREALYVQNRTGRVGVGTSSPGTELDVAGSVRASGDVSGGRLLDNGSRVLTESSLFGGDVRGGHASLSIADGAVTTSKISAGAVNGTRLQNGSIDGAKLVPGTFSAIAGIGTLLQDIDLGGNGLHNASSVNASVVNASLLCVGSECLAAWPPLDGAGSAGYVPLWQDNSFLNASSGLFAAGGNVGVGTVSPSAALDVEGDVRASGDVRGLRLFDGGNRALTESTLFGGDVRGAFGALSIASGAVGNAKIAPAAVNGTQIQDGSIDDSKMVSGVFSRIAGIGTLTQDLDAGGRRVFNASLLCLGQDCRTGWPPLNGSGAAGSVALWENSTLLNGSSGLYVTGGGLGVGTAIPAERLDVAGSVRASGDVAAARLLDSGSRVLNESSPFGGDVSGVSGALSLSPGAVTGPKIAAGAVGSAHIQDGAITNADLAVGEFLNVTGIGTLSRNLDLGGNRLLNTLQVNTALLNASLQACLGGDCRTAWPAGLSDGLAGYLPLWNGTASLNNSRLYQAADGKVGLGTTAPLDPLHVVGDIRVGTGTRGCVKDADGTVIAGVCVSDARLKENITPMEAVADRVARLKPVSFTWRNGSGETQYGLIAQDVERVLPELADEGDDGYKRVHFEYLPFFMLRAIQEQQARLDAQRAQIESLRAELCRSSPAYPWCPASASPGRGPS